MTRAEYIARAKRIAELYFEEWGAAKGAEMECLVGEQAMDPENALLLIRDLLQAAERAAE